jgi:hypothetical protein
MKAIIASMMVALTAVFATLIDIPQILQASSSFIPGQVVTTSITTVVTVVSSTTTMTTGITVTSAATVASTLVTFGPSGGTAIPGFPWESIVAGIAVGIAALGLLRSRRTK